MVEYRPNYDRNRQRLADIIPLSHPFTIYIEQTKYCNFKCYYCMHSTHDKKNGIFTKNGHNMQHMNFNDYKNLIAQLSDLGIKRIVFSGLGEPLANPSFPDFVRYAVEANIAERVEVLTNGALITEDYADALIGAGITNINISIQGNDAATYERVCGVKLDFDKFLANLAYLYKNKGKAKIYIKCMDSILKNTADKEEFYKLYGGIADRIYIEHLVVMQQSMDNLWDLADTSKNLYGENIRRDRDICAQCFYFLQAGVDGEVYPCSIPGLTHDFSIGNFTRETLKEIWNGEKRRQHLHKMLSFKRKDIPQCRNCSCFHCISDPLEYLDADADRLRNFFE